MYLLSMLVFLLGLHLIHISNAQVAESCEIHRRLRDKWYFLDQSQKTYVRVRSSAVIFKMERNPKIRFQCVESRGSIYLLRKVMYRPGKDAVLCLGFSYIADHPHAEYSIIRLISPGERSHLMSPILLNHSTPISIDATCNMISRAERRHTAFVQRQRTGCKFPENLVGNWSYTYQYARRLMVGPRTMTLELLNSSSITFRCDSKDRNFYILRVRNYNQTGKDVIMCIQISFLRTDPYYSFEISRLNSGNLMDGLLRCVPAGKRVHLYQDCDLLDSPARSEYLYP